MAIDISGGQYNGNIYVSLTESITYPWPIKVSYSANGGTSFSLAEDISGSATGVFSQGVNLSVGHDGVVYAVWAINDQPWTSGYYGSDGIGFNKSTDGGLSWPFVDRILEIVGSRDFWGNKNPDDRFIRMNDFPCIAVDRSGGPWNGTLYLIWGEKGMAPDRADIRFSKSSDGGLTWSPFGQNQ
jgi:hypothetical protein